MTIRHRRLSANAHRARRATPSNPLFRWVQYPLWRGVALGLAAILLAMFTHLTQTPEGILLMAGLGRLAVLILVPARFIVTLHLMKREQKG